MKKFQKGITLIALVITIIVLLILAGVTISMLTGENGILNQSQRATTETYHGTVKDQIILGANQYQIAKNTEGYTDDVISYLVNQNYIIKIEGQEYYRVLVENIAQNIKTGQGANKEAGDVYVIENEEEQNSKQYVLKYYDKSNTSKILLYLSGNGDTTDVTPGTDGDEIPSYPTSKKIQYVEDILDIAMDVENGKNYENQKIVLENDLDFSDKSCYKNPDQYYTYNGEIISLDSLTSTDSFPETDTVYKELQENENLGSTPGFIQIGRTEDKTFKGVFDGNNHTLSNVYINTFAILGNENIRQSTGIFGYNDGYICNLKVDKINIKLLSYKDNSNNANYNNQKVGVLAGINNGTIYNCETNGEYIYNYSGYINFGGIAYVNNNKIKKCNVKGTTNISAYYGNVGGIVSSNNQNGIVERCDSYLDLCGNIQYAGGIVGFNQGNISYCENYANKMSGNSSQYVGGIVGINVDGSITYCNNYCTNATSISKSFGGIVGFNRSETAIDNCNNGNTETVTDENTFSDLPNVGGIIGDNDNYSSLTITNCKNYMNINSNDSASGIVSLYNTSSIGSINISNCENYGNLGQETYSLRTSYVAGIISIKNSSFSSEKLIITNCTNSGSCSGPEAVGGIVNNTRNISSIDIIKCNNTNTVKNEYGSYGLGGIVGKAANQSGGKIKIENCINTGSIETTKDNPFYIGGIIGCGEMDKEIINCKNTANITNDGNTIGGIIGKTSKATKISNCENIGNITGRGSYVAGIVGVAAGDLELDNCRNSGNITSSDNNVSGIVGGFNSYSNSSPYILNNCINFGDIKGNYYVSGICNVSNSNNITLTNCGNIGNIEGTENYVVGLLTRNTSSGIANFNNCFNIGDIKSLDKSSDAVAGISISNSNMSNVYNAGQITSGSSICASTYSNSSSTFENVYSLENCASYVYKKETETSGIEILSETNMKAQSFIEKLNANKGNLKNWIAGTDDSKGYPILE